MLFKVNGVFIHGMCHKSEQLPFLIAALLYLKERGAAEKRSALKGRRLKKEQLRDCSWLLLQKALSITAQLLNDPLARNIYPRDNSFLRLLARHPFKMLLKLTVSLFMECAIKTEQLPFLIAVPRYLAKKEEKAAEKL
ncbi:hypothetical protein CDAR_267561 [Caerostris darwini]|uniref:Uncharacterized protein n=1 Tax=Caerostris darwini TaxID=1538125 RepID=A0AAV4TJT0_9ARAC|nr:hypothetical protein CDAR_267561 [Caerostris darwini]